MLLCNFMPAHIKCSSSVNRPKLSSCLFPFSTFWHWCVEIIPPPQVPV